MPPNTTPVSSPTTDPPCQEFPHSTSPNQPQGHGRAITKSAATEPSINYSSSEYGNGNTEFPEFLYAHAGHSPGNVKNSQRPKLHIANQHGYNFRRSPPFAQGSSSAVNNNNNIHGGISRTAPIIGPNTQPPYSMGHYAGETFNMLPGNVPPTTHWPPMYSSPPMEHLTGAVRNMAFSDELTNLPQNYKRPGNFSNNGSSSVPHFHNGNIPATELHQLSQRSPKKNSWPTQNVPQPIGSKERRPLINQIDEADSDEEDDPLHPNKFSTIFEFHTRKECGYKRQITKSGEKEKQVSEKVYIPHTGQHEIQHKTIRYYQKDLVRYCICGKYEDKSCLLDIGRNNDCKGYEIHYSRKCKWKGYTDFETKQRVLIRLCKCYKPT